MLNELFFVRPLVPMKFAPLPAMIVVGLDGQVGLAVDRGYGLEAPFDLSDESIQAIREVED
jgi:hypothetical protein